MAKRTKRRTRPELDQVIAGRVNLPAHQLIDLIHRVNPTGQELSRKEMEARYRQKCALQNQLISHYKDEVQIVPDPNQPGIVTIRYQGRDACHALLAELAVDVRAWAQRYLDDHRLEDDASAAPIAAEKPQRESRTASVGRNQPGSQLVELTNKSVGELVELGRNALESYDFETVRHLFRTATERAEDEPVAAAAYLGFLVDTMGDYAAALEVGETLSRRVSAAADVRELLGLAAARAGKGALAEFYLKRLTGARAAEAYRTLCADAVTAQELVRAEYFLEEARQRDDGRSGQIGRLSESIDALRRRLRQPLEEALERLFAAGDLERAAESARQCLDQWPDSRVARSILDRIEERRTQEKIQALTARAREALQVRAYADALEDFQRALALGCSPQELGDDLRLARREAEKQNEREQIEALRRRLTEQDRSEGLLAYLSAKSALRARIRAELGLPVLEWLERMGAASSASKARTAVEGVLALEEALAAMKQGSIEHAANLLSQHEKVIADLPETRQVWKNIESLQSEARHRVAHQMLAEAQQAMQVGRSEQALRLLSTVDQRALTALEQKQAADWLHALRQQEEHRTLRKRVDSLLAEGQPLAARRLLDKLIDVAAEREKQELLDERRRLTKQIDREWRIPLEMAPDLSRLLLLLNLSWFQEQTNRWLLPDGDGMVVAYSMGRTLFVGLIDPVAGTVPRHALIAVPQRWEGSIEAIVHGDRVSLIRAEGNLLELELDPWSILRCESFDRFIAPGEIPEQLFYCPGDRFCWIESSERRGSFHVRVIDLEQWREHRSLSGVRMRPIPVVGGRGLFLVEDQADSTINLYAISGKRLQNYPGLAYHIVTGAVMQKSSGSIAVLSYEVDDDENDFPLIVSIVDRQGEVSLQYKVADSYGELLSSLAVSGEFGAIFILYRSEQGLTLLALKPSSKRLEPIYEVSVPGDAALVCDEAITQVTLLISAIDGSVQAVSLGGNRPVLDAGDARGTLIIPRFEPPFPLCLTSYGSVASAFKVPKHLASAAHAELLIWVEARVYDCGRNAQKLKGLVEALIIADRNDVIRSAVVRQLEKGNALLLREYATLLVEKECWEEAIGILPRRLPAAHDWTGDEEGHVAHLLGIALYRSGRIGEALTVWQNAGSNNFCDLQPYIDLAGYFVRSEQAAADEQPLHRLMKCIEAADRQLEANNYRAAIQLLDCPLVWTAMEMQSLARLVFSLLKEERKSPYDNFIQLMAVSCLLKVTDSSRDFGFGRPQLSFPGQWNVIRVDAVVERARGWWDSNIDRSSAAHSA